MGIKIEYKCEIISRKKYLISYQISILNYVGYSNSYRLLALVVLSSRNKKLPEISKGFLFCILLRLK